MSRTNPLPRDFRSIVPGEVEAIKTGLRQSANERFTEKMRDELASGLDATPSGKQERDQMRRELWGDV